MHQETTYMFNCLQLLRILVILLTSTGSCFCISRLCPLRWPTDHWHRQSFSRAHWLFTCTCVSSLPGCQPTAFEIFPLNLCLGVKESLEYALATFLPNSYRLSGELHTTFIMMVLGELERILVGVDCTPVQRHRQRQSDNREPWLECGEEEERQNRPRYRSLSPASRHPGTLLLSHLGRHRSA